MQQKRTRKQMKQQIGKEPRQEKFFENFANNLPDLAQLLFNIGISASIYASNAVYGPEWQDALRIRQRLQTVVEKEFSKMNHSFPEATGVILFTSQFLRESMLPQRDRVN